MDGEPEAATVEVDAAQLMRIVRLLPDVLFSCFKADDGKIYWSVNEGGLAEEFGLTTKNIVGKSLDELFPGGASDELHQHFEDAFIGKPYIFTNEIEGRHFRHYPQPVYDEAGEVESVVGYIAEVTDLVKTQEKLAKANVELQTFAHAISHDLQNPLAAMQMFLHVLLLHPERFDDKTRSILERMERTATRMQYIAEDTLYLSKVSKEGLERTEVDVTELSKTISVGLEATRPDRIVTWEFQDGMSINADVRLSRIVFENLLGNAWKYSDDAEKPCIRVYQEEIDGRRWTMVEDNGRGFDPADAKRIFQPFERAHEGPVQGSGVGLSTVRRVMDRHGGEILSDAEPGKGAVFKFTFDAIAEKTAS